MFEAGSRDIARVLEENVCELRRLQRRDLSSAEHGFTVVVFSVLQQCLAVLDVVTCADVRGVGVVEGELGVVSV